MFLDVDIDIDTDTETDVDIDTHTHTLALSLSLSLSRTVKPPDLYGLGEPGRTPTTMASSPGKSLDLSTTRRIRGPRYPLRVLWGS